MDLFFIPFYIANAKNIIVHAPAGEEMRNAQDIVGRIQALDADWTCIVGNDGWVHVGLPMVPGHVAVKTYSNSDDTFFYGCVFWGSPRFFEKVSVQRICDTLGSEQRLVDRFQSTTLKNAFILFAHCFTGYGDLLMDLPAFRWWNNNVSMRIFPSVGLQHPHSEPLSRFYLIK